MTPPPLHKLVIVWDTEAKFSRLLAAAQLVATAALAASHPWWSIPSGILTVWHLLVMWHCQAIARIMTLVLEHFQGYIPEGHRLMVNVKSSGWRRVHVELTLRDETALWMVLTRTIYFGVDKLAALRGQGIVPISVTHDTSETLTEAIHRLLSE